MADPTPSAATAQTPDFPNLINPETQEDFLSLYKMRDVGEYVRLVLHRFAVLSIYIIEPYIPRRTDGALVIPANEGYQIHDYGDRVVIAAQDIYTTPLFATTPFLLAIHQALELLLTADIKEIAVLGDPRAKHFFWDMCERKKALENRILSLLNFSPPEAFGLTREAVMRYLKTHGLVPITSLLPSKPTAAPGAGG